MPCFIFIQHQVLGADSPDDRPHPGAVDKLRDIAAGVLSLLVLSLCLCLAAFRWVKFEEKVEEGGERWSKPHVSTLSLHSLFELRTCLQTGTVLLDLEGYSLPQIVGEMWFFYGFVVTKETIAYVRFLNTP